MKTTIILLLALSTLAHADLAGERAYANYVMQYAGHIYVGESTYSSGWARGMTPSQARDHARSSFSSLSASERARWSNAGRTSITLRTPPSSSTADKDPSPGRQSTSTPRREPQRGITWHKFIGED